MEIFISWSGERSHAVATALRNWLPKIINALKPWLSSSDIGKGSRWGADMASKLTTAKAGIICLTPDNLHADWILFEAGALSRAVETSRVCTLLIGLEPSDLEPPLSQFQATKANEADILALVKTLNRALGEMALAEEHITEAFQMCWPTLKSELDKMPVDKTEGKPVRSERQLIEEILTLVRNQSAAPPPSAIVEEDREHVLRGRVNKLIFKAGGATGISASNDGSNIRFEVRRGEDQKYSVTIPKNISLEELETYVQAQIPSKDALPPADSKTAGP